MSFDAASLRDALARHGRIARVVVARVSGSAPREAGASMLVWKEDQQGTIGGGTLELEAAEVARRSLHSLTPAQVATVPLGPALGQCCGGAVTLVTEVLGSEDVDRLCDTARNGTISRPVTASKGPQPLSVTRALATRRNGSEPPRTQLVEGWLIEPLAAPRHALWLYGAGHVGRAILTTLAPLPDWQITWVDTHADRFPADLPPNVTRLVAADPARAVPHASAEAHHLILTYSHAMDLELCHALLAHGFSSAGLIGSATKWARFRTRLRQLGHSDASIARITCPIGHPAFGKHPQAIAIGVTALLLTPTAAISETAMDRPA